MTTTNMIVGHNGVFIGVLGISEASAPSTVSEQQLSLLSPSVSISLPESSHQAGSNGTSAVCRLGLSPREWVEMANTKLNEDELLNVSDMVAGTTISNGRSPSGLTVLQLMLIRHVENTVPQLHPPAPETAEQIHADLVRFMRAFKDDFDLFRTLLKYLSNGGA